MRIPTQPADTVNVRQSDYSSLSKADVLIAGLGGMGVIGLTQRIGALLRSRFNRVFTKESRGFAPRRASVTGAVRAGRGVRTPELIGTVDLLLALEAAEALRHEKMIGPGSQVVMSDTCDRPGGHAGRDFRPIDVAQIEARLASRGARVLRLPVCAWLRTQGLSQLFASSAMLGAFTAIAGLGIELVEDLVRDSWQGEDREGNLAACRWAHGHVLSLGYLGQVAEAA